MAESFEKLKIWQSGYDLVVKVAKLVSDFPDYQKYGLSAQLLRSSNSIIANIAESQGRYSYADKIRVLYISRGELFETMSHLKVAKGLDYINEPVFNELDAEYSNLLLSLNGYIKFLSEKSDSSNQPVN